MGIGITPNRPSAKVVVTTSVRWAYNLVEPVITPISPHLIPFMDTFSAYHCLDTLFVRSSLVIDSENMIVASRCCRLPCDSSLDATA